MRWSFIPVLAIIVAMGCSKRPEGVAGDKKMVEVMTDLEIAEAYMQTNSNRYVTKDKERMVESILEKHSMTRDEFDSTLSWYGRNIDKYEELYARVDRNLQKKSQSISGNIETVSNDLWPYTRNVLISPLGTSDNLVFEIEGKDLKKGDRVNFRLKLSNPANGMSVLGVRYEDGHISYLNQSLTGRQSLDITLQTDTGKIVKKIFGNIRIADGNVLPMRLDSISLSSIPYDSVEYYQINRSRHFYGPVRKVVEKKTETDS